MRKEDFIPYEKVKNILAKNEFFGMTCKRDNGKLTYKYHNIHYHTVCVSVVVAKLQPNEIKSPKAVLAIYVNGKNLDGWKDLIYTLNNLGKIHHKEFVKTFKQVK